MKNKCKPVYNHKTMKWECSKCKVTMKNVAEIRECNDITNLFGGLFNKK